MAILKKVTDAIGNLIYNKSDSKMLHTGKMERLNNQYQQLVNKRDRKKREYNFMPTSDGKMKVTKPII